MDFLRQWESVPGSLFCCFILVLLVFAAREVQFYGLPPAAAQLEVLLTNTFCGEPCRKAKSELISCHSICVQSAASGTNNLHFPFHPGHRVWEGHVRAVVKLVSVWLPATADNWAFSEPEDNCVGVKKDQVGHILQQDVRMLMKLYFCLLSLSRYKLKFSPDKVDTMIIQAICKYI